MINNILSKKRKIHNFFDLLDLPDPMHSEEDFNTVFNYDLDGMTPAELWRENERTRLMFNLYDNEILNRYLYIGTDSEITVGEWLQERLKKIDRLTRASSRISKPVRHRPERVAKEWT